jgi:choline transport protein
MANLFGWVSVLATVVNLSAIVLQSMISLQNPNYIPERWHTACLVIAMLLLYGAINSMRWTFIFVPWLELAAGILHVSLFILFITGLTVMGSRNSTDYIFFHREIWSGWDNQSVLSWHLGMLTCVSSFISLDSFVHMAEETRLAKKAVPRAVFWGITLNGAMGFAMVICVLSVMGPMDEELAFAPYQMSVVLMRVTQSADAATAMICGILVIFICSGLGGVASVSRLSWAWARDEGLPRWFAVVDAKHRLPIRAIWLGLGLNMALALIDIGSTTAYGALVSLATISLFSSYGLAILSMLAARWRSHQGKQNLELGEWNMGKWGVYVNAYAIIYTVYMAVFLPIPYSLPVTAATMNYAGPIFVALIIYVLSSWYLWGRKKWPGINNDIVEFVKEHAGSEDHSPRTA